MHEEKSTTVLTLFNETPGPILGQKSGQVCRKALNKKERRHGAAEPLELDSARRLRGIHFIDSDDLQVKDTMKSARKKLELPVESSMLCKLPLGTEET